MTAQPTPGGESVRLLDTDVEFRIFQDDDFLAGSTGRSDAEHYVAVYGQDGPVERQTSINLSFDGFLSDEAISAIKARVSRPQPSAGQDGGGDGAWGWRVRSPAVAGRPAGPWHWQAEEPSGSTADFTEWEQVYTRPQALASPAKATGWPSREDVARVIDDEPFMTLEDWFTRGKQTCFELGFKWSEKHEALARRNLEVSARNLDRRNAALAKADAIIALFPRPEDEGAAT